MEFDPKNYDYLDEYEDRKALRVYLWEFIRRHRELEEVLPPVEIVKLRQHREVKRKEAYIDIFAYLKTLPETSIRLNDEYNIFSPSERIVNIVSDSPEVQWCFDTIKKKYGITVTFLDNESKGYHKMQVSDKDMLIGIPDPSLRYVDIDPKPYIRGSSPVAFSKFNEDAHKKLHDEYLDTFVDKLTISSRQHTIYVGIPTTGQPHAINEALKAIVKAEVKKAKIANAAPKAWKSYLMYYDLAEELQLKDTPRKEAEAIEDNFKRHGKKASWKTVHEALIIIRALIQTDFANYLFLA